MPINIHNNIKLKTSRRKLRNNATPAEKLLWSELNNKQLKNRKFRRQHSIGPFVVDFFCYREKLILELDGEIHDDIIVKQYDSKREKYLINHGFKVLRFHNEEIFSDLEGVISKIEDDFNF